jgi:hypothetical protein
LLLIVGGVREKLLIMDLCLLKLLRLRLRGNATDLLLNSRDSFNG